MHDGEADPWGVRNGGVGKFSRAFLGPRLLRDYRSELCMRKSTVGGIKLKMTGWIGLKLTDKELPELTYLGDQAVPL